MAVHLTGTDINGIVSAGAGEIYVTRASEVITNSGGRVFLASGTGSQLILGGMMVVDNAFGSGGADFGGFSDCRLNVLEGGSIAGQYSSVISEGDYFALSNAGAIASEYRAVYMMGRYADIVNTGTISSVYSEAVRIASSGEIRNLGQITGLDGILVTSAVASSNTTNIHNSGEIFASDDAVNMSQAWGRTQVFNSGTIASGGRAASSRAIIGGVDEDEIENHGRIVGNVRLRAGDDRFLQLSGSLEGKLDFGSGDDAFVVADFGEGVSYDLDGGPGSDMLDFSDFDHGIWVNLEYRGNEVWTRDSMDVSSGAWRSIANADNFEAVTGTEGIDYLSGNEADNLFVYMGSALIAGNETMIGKGGSDTADFSRFASAVWVNLESGTREAWTKDTDTVIGGGGTWRSIVEMQGMENVVGTFGIDEFQGNADANTFTYIGHSGAQAVLGTERFDGRGGSDTLDMSRFERAVWVDLTSAVEVYTQDNYDTTNGGGNWRALVDLVAVENIVGTLGNEILRGDAADNVIDGYTGSDIITGRGGNDTFVFGSYNGIFTGEAHITDFSTDDAEKIDLSQLASITDFTDLITNHVMEYGGVLLINSGSGAIYLDGYTMADIGVGHAIGEADFLF